MDKTCSLCIKKQNILKALLKVCVWSHSFDSSSIIKVGVDLLLSNEEAILSNHYKYQTSRRYYIKLLTAVEFINHSNKNHNNDDDEQKILI